MAVQSQEGSGTTVAFTFPAAVGEEPMDSTFSSDSSEYLQDRFSPVYGGAVRSSVTASDVVQGIWKGADRI